MKIKYCIPSYHRPDGVTTLDYIPKKGILYVSPEDYPDYIEAMPQHRERIVMVPEGVQGKGKAHVMNWLLDNVWDDDTDAMIFIDDDVDCIMAHTKHIDGRKDYEKTEDEFYFLCENFSRMALEWGLGMWGFHFTPDPMSYHEYAPFRTLSYLDGGIQGFVKNELRYDEVLTVKEDVDMFLQNVQRFHGAMRIDRYYLKKKSFEGKGGSQEFRKENVEKEQFQMMQRKWGSDIIRPNKPKGNKTSGIRGEGGAIKLNIPIKGV